MANKRTVTCASLGCVACRSSHRPELPNKPRTLSDSIADQLSSSWRLIETLLRKTLRWHTVWQIESWFLCLYSSESAMSGYVFVAYPCATNIVVDAIRTAVSTMNARHSEGLIFETWEEMDVPGRFIASEVLQKIDSAEALVADISRLNFNVTYEIGYGIGRGKRILLVKNLAVQSQTPTIQEVGIFDTLGYKDYARANDLISFFCSLKDLRPIHVAGKRNEKSPIYLVQPKTKTDYDGLIVAGIKKSHLYFRSFDPSETARLAGPDAVENVAEAYGVILHFLSDEHIDSKIHNIRSAFVAGLADGMDRRSLFIQTGDTPIPLDLRDFVTTCRFPNEFAEAIGKLAERVYDDRSAVGALKPSENGSLLELADLGASAAENEITSLGEYYLETEAFRRAKRREVRLVTGRKGSGKTAIFFMLRDHCRENRKNVVLDLKPEGYQLMKLKDAVTTLLSRGTVEHTITAFWEYLLWLEVCYKLLEKDQELHKRDHRLFEPYQRLKAAYSTDTYSSEGDFAERLKALLRDIIVAVERKYEGRLGLELTTPQITELVYRHNFHDLRTQIVEYLQYKDELWLLFDNIDKGWAAQGVNSEDLVILRALMEATRKIERELTKVSITAHTIVFLRNDVFEHLVESTSDRGKETRSNVDWDDPELLQEVIRRRLARALPDDQQDADFSTVWTSICVPIIDGEDTAQYLINRSLMRPRSLLDLVGHCKGYALNLGHQRIEKGDIQKGCKAFSNDLLSELDLEIRDIFSSGGDLLYAFIASPTALTREQLDVTLATHGIAPDLNKKVIDVLLWFGFLGFLWSDGTPRYIYSFNYNMKVLDGIHAKMVSTGDIRYVINPAFAPALGVS